MDAMLLPSALSCEARPPLLRRAPYAPHLQPVLSIEQPSPPPLPSRQGNGLRGTCRALQALLTGSPSPASSPKSAVRPPRLQSPAPIDQTPLKATKAVKAAKVVKPVPPRGVRKRKREAEDYGSQSQENNMIDSKFSTPKRRRIVPSQIPLGLSQSDFDSLQTPASGEESSLQTPAMPPMPQSEFPIPSSSSEGGPRAANGCGDPMEGDWTPEDDGLLVGIVLEKLKLTKKDWSECARKIGKDNDSVGKRWKALVGEGEVGLRRGRGKSTRPKLEDIWGRE